MMLAALVLAALPAGYFPLLERGAADARAYLDAAPEPTLKALESDRRWVHFPYTILPPAVLYARGRRDPAMRDLAIRIGDLLAAEDEKGVFAPRLDSDWDTYMWLEAYRLLERELGGARRERWKRAIERNVALFAGPAAERVDFPWYNSPYISTSPNHYSLWAANLLLAARVFGGHKDWDELGARILRRFATEEQAPDGFWGEHARSGPAIGYNHLTLSAVALYWELTKDPAALAAIRRATDFHKNFTWPDGTPVETVNNRNRYWALSAWSHFAFSNFADGRGYAEFLASKFDAGGLSANDMGRLAQNALYYHEGATEPPPQAKPAYAYRMALPAGIRKTGPWAVAYSGIIDTQAPRNQFYLDRQANLSVFHEKLGLIVSGANSKRQPGLATFAEKLLGQVFYLPLSSRLQMSDAVDRLSLAYNAFWADVLVPRPSPAELNFRVEITGVGSPPDDAQFTLQLVLKPGEQLETGTGRRITVGAEAIDLAPEALGGLLRHHGWTMKLDPGAALHWPVYPFNPYADAPEKTLEHAVATLKVPLRLKSQPGRSVRPKERELAFTIEAR